MQIFAPFMLKRKHRFVRLAALVLPLLLAVVLLSQTAMAQNTYVITDGDQVTVHTSFATNPETVLLEAGVELAENDFYTTADGDGVSEIKVQREMTVTINNCGQIVTAASYGETLYALLEREGIETYGPYTYPRIWTPWSMTAWRLPSAMWSPPRKSTPLRSLTR